VGPWTKVFDTLAVRHPHGSARRSLRGKGLHDGGLADTGLSGDTHHLPGPLLCVYERPLELLMHRLAFDKQGSRAAGA
jgi:hypothetical protein